jgi:tetratricopeptide (TPR) repeat protein
MIDPVCYGRFRGLLGKNMRARKLVIGSGLLFAVATSVPAFAQSASGGAPAYPAACGVGSVPQSESERAHTIYQAGKVQYDDKNYDAAIAQFREAYKRDCSKHELLIIISRAYELKGDKAEALRALETYLERVPNSPDAATHRNGIDSLKRQIAAQPPPPPAAAATTTATAPSTAPVETHEHTVPPWIVVGLGGAVAIAGVVLLVAKPSSDCNLDQEVCTRDVKNNETDAAFKARQKDAVREKSWGIAGPIMIGGGLAIVAGGLLWHFLEPTGPAEKTGKTKPKLNPSVAPGYAGVSFGGNF